MRAERRVPQVRGLLGYGGAVYKDVELSLGSPGPLRNFLDARRGEVEHVLALVAYGDKARLVGKGK